jgi:hypothetical protein
MPQPPPRFQTAQDWRAQDWHAQDWCARALRLLCLLAMGATLAACDRCGNFLPTSLGQSGACHSDPPPR